MCWKSFKKNERDSQLQRVVPIPEQLEAQSTSKYTHPIRYSLHQPYYLRLHTGIGVLPQLALGRFTAGSSFENSPHCVRTARCPDQHRRRCLWILVSGNRMPHPKFFGNPSKTTKLGHLWHYRFRLDPERRFRHCWTCLGSRTPRRRFLHMDPRLVLYQQSVFF